MRVKEVIHRITHSFRELGALVGSLSLRDSLNILRGWEWKQECLAEKVYRTDTIHIRKQRAGFLYFYTLLTHYYFKPFLVIVIIMIMTSIFLKVLSVEINSENLNLKPSLKN